MLATVSPIKHGGVEMAFPSSLRAYLGASRPMASFAVFLGSALLGNCLHAQLRTGSSSRSLYAAAAVEEVAKSAEPQQRSASTPAVSTRKQGTAVKQGTALRPKPTKTQKRPENASSASTPVSGVRQASAARYQTESTVEGDISTVEGDISIVEGDIPDQQTASDDAAYEVAPQDGFSEYASTGCDSGHCDSGCCDAGPHWQSNYFFGPSPLQSLLSRLSVRAEMPIFWRRGHSTPALVTTAPGGTASNVAGQLGQNSTQILQGGVFGQDAEAGIRITLGAYLDPCKNYGVLFRYWNAGTRTDQSQFDSDEFPILARPFLNTSGTGTPANDTQLIAFPGDSVGNIQVSGRSQLYGLDVSLRRMWYADRFTRIDWLYGYQHMLIGERLLIDSETSVTGNVPPIQGSTIAVSDRFQTENSFHGSTLGVLWNRRVACFRFENMIRLGFGNLRREIQIAGSTQTTSAGTTNTLNEGLLARSTNSRSVIDNTFVIAPEAGINLAWALNPYMDFTIGYNYQMLPKVQQAGQLIDPDLRVNLSDPLTGTLDPAFQIREGRYWVRTLGLGLQVRY